jgi:hypothetical protein
MLKRKLTLNLVTVLFSVTLIIAWIYLAKKDVELRLFEEQRLTLDLKDGFDPYYLKTDVSKLIRIDSIQKLGETRKKLVEFLWGSPALPPLLPKDVYRNHKDGRFEEIENLSRIDLLSVEMGHDLVSKIYHFIPEISNGKIILYHQGHSGGFILGKKVIAEFIRYGYSVVGFSMPLRGMNSQPDILLERFGWFKFENHIEMSVLLPESGHALQFFVEPVIQVINYLDQRFDYSLLAMVGISGGGWTTTVAAAIDPRIKASFSVAGGVPLYLRTRNDNDWGSWEETVPQFNSIANYLELYILGAVGPGRIQWQIFNFFDPCCYSGDKSKTFGNIVSSLVKKFGDGKFNLYIDDTHYEHEVSQHVVKRIEEELLTLTQSSLQ